MARNTMQKDFSLNDHLFNEETVSYLASCFKDFDSIFNDTEFVREVCKAFPSLTLKERISRIAEVLAHHLPNDFEESSAIIRGSLPEPLDPTRTDDDFGSFIFAPLGAYVVQHGCTEEHLDTAYTTLHAITQRFSMEDSIRSFINRFPTETLAVLTRWAVDPHYHVRRLVSEGTRPLLPWSGRIVYDHTTTLPLLDSLYADRTRYVTRSVANHLNDISKKHPQLVIARLQKWEKEGRQAQDELDWIKRHALRTLLKQGNQDALALLGYDLMPKIEVVSFTLAKHAEILSAGETLEFMCEIHAHADVRLMIDYSIDFVKARGGTKPKMFKLKKVFLKKGESCTLTKRQRLLADATTYRLYSGEHRVTIYINGVAHGTVPFTIDAGR